MNSQEGKASPTAPLSLDEIATAIKTNVDVVTSYLKTCDSSNLNSSFTDDNGGLDFPDGSEHAELQHAREQLMYHSQQLHDCMAGPSWMMTMFPLQALYDLAALQTIRYFDIINLIPSVGSISVLELASKAKIAPQRLVSNLCYLVHRRIFTEPTPGQFAHSPASLMWRRPDCQGWVNHFVLEGTKCISVMNTQYDRFGGEDMSSLHSAVSVVYDNYTDSPMEISSSGEGKAALFNEAMKWFSGFGPVHDQHVINGFPWEEFAGSTVVDVAGGGGHLSFALARKYPQLEHLIVQDLAGQIAVSEIPVDLVGRVEFQEFDLFQPNPMAADLYILRFILHDFDDDSCVQILRNLVSAIKGEASIIVLEGILGVDHGKSSTDRLLGALNMSMTTDFNGSERSLEDWAKVFTRADPRLELRRVVSPPGSLLSVLEIRCTKPKPALISDVI